MSLTPITEDQCYSQQLSRDNQIQVQLNIFLTSTLHSSYFSNPVLSLWLWILDSSLINDENLMKELLKSTWLWPGGDCNQSICWRKNQMNEKLNGLTSWGFILLCSFAFIFQRNRRKIKLKDSLKAGCGGMRL